MKEKILKVKLCGFKDKDLVDFAIGFDVDFLGFIFYEPSPRYVDIKEIPQIISNIPNNIKKVAVIVDASNEQIKQIISALKPDFLQLHGSETLSRVKEIKELFQIPIIKVFKVATRADLADIAKFEDVAEYFLFDTKISGHHGGSGKSFDWKILHDLETKKEWFLSGGIGLGNIDQIMQNSDIKMIDLSSAIEEERGIKSKKLIAEFMNKIVTKS